MHLETVISDLAELVRFRDERIKAALELHPLHFMLSTGHKGDHITGRESLTGREKYACGSCNVAWPCATVEALSGGVPDAKPEQRAEVVTLCGSTKFKDAINAENKRLTMAGCVVISLGVFGHTDLPDYNWDTDASDLKTMLDGLHFQKIRMADRVHVVNVGGYYGESTAREIAYARSLGKPVTFMEAQSGE